MSGFSYLIFGDRQLSGFNDLGERAHQARHHCRSMTGLAFVIKGAIAFLQIVNAGVDQADVARFNLYKLRHSFATRLRREGGRIGDTTLPTRACGLLYAQAAVPYVRGNVRNRQ